MAQGHAQTVLQVCHTSMPPFDDVARQWRVLFEDTGFRVVTVFLTGQTDDGVKELVGGDVIFLGYSSRDLRGLKRRPIADMRRLHAEFGFRLLIAHRYKPIYIAAHIPEVPLIAVSHGAGVYDGFFRRQFIRRRARRSLLVGVSDAVREEIRRTVPGFPHERILCLHNHLDLDRVRTQQYDREEARRRLGLPPDAFVLGNVGRLHSDKDQHTLIEAFARAVPSLSRPMLAIVGVGPLEEELQRRAEALGVADQVRLLGWVPRAWRYFRAFDRFVLTSRREGFGMVLLEAMAAEVPVISSRVGGAPEVVGECGGLFEQGDVETLTALMLESRAGNSGADGLERVEKHFSDRAARADFWRQLEASGLPVSSS